MSWLRLGQPNTPDNLVSSLSWLSAQIEYVSKIGVCEAAEEYQFADPVPDRMKCVRSNQSILAVALVSSSSILGPSLLRTKYKQLFECHKLYKFSTQDIFQ